MEQDDTKKMSEIFEQQCKEHEVAAAQKYESPIVGFGHALLAAVMRAKIIQYDFTKRENDGRATGRN